MTIIPATADMLRSSLFLNSLYTLIPAIDICNPVWGFTLSNIDGITSYLKGIPSPQDLGGLSPMGYVPGDSLKIRYFSDLYNLAELFLSVFLCFTYNTT